MFVCRYDSWHNTLNRPHGAHLLCGVHSVSVSDYEGLRVAGKEQAVVDAGGPCQPQCWLHLPTRGEQLQAPRVRRLHQRRITRSQSGRMD